ncbi:RHS repeat-associated core domain-containing protein [Actinokineospora globicatena]|uniref:RHS repeat-associated core domain-containing protein n=1 Tax=Actinokineospora globicatena TaxID=103729 RepID=UPI0020A4C39F|nr:RHS repeat-associated core domain-containing protein [Actinokineospora globicatena]MCP2300493.1 RHS repeat-associated core domain-containing protein [Actinokineospora globicatena]GLW81029.1 type IV secretion protein Rhs [Actinokineospora globicatena]GLW88222.1 type IV secretion protein Rhs [Actinokineospora globicatena]
MSNTGRRLRACAVAAAVVSSMIVANPQAVAAPKLPATAWAAPATVDRTPSGGAPPATAASVARASCISSPEGVLPDQPFERFKVSDRFQAAVELHRGYLWFRHRGLTVRGTGLNLDLGYVYTHSAPYGDQWLFNAGRDMALDLSFLDTVIMRVDSGGCVTFRKNADGSYRTEGRGVRVKLTKNPGGSFTARYQDSGETWSYDAFGWPLNRTDRNGNSITYYYNGDGSLASLTDTQGRVTTFVNDSNGDVAQVIDPTGTVAARYDGLGTANATITDRDGKTYQITLTGNFYQASALVDPLGRQWSFEYDASTGDITKVVTPRQAGVIDTRFTNDWDTRTGTETDPNGNTTTYTFDTQGRQLSAKDALGHSKAQTWTASSQVQSVADGLTNSTTATFDTADNLISTKLPTGAESTVGYTNTALPSLPTSIKDPAGNELTHEYDAAGNLTKIRSTPLAADLDVRTYTSPKRLLATQKDANGTVTRFGYDGPGNLTSVTPPSPLGVTRYGYDSLSRVTSITDGAGKKVDYAYDKLDRVVAISSGGTVSQTNTYDALGNLLTRATPTVTTTLTYDVFTFGSQPTSVKRTQGGTSETVTYTYDKSGNLKTLTDPSGTTTYGYDAANRLLTLADAFGQTTTFTYDNADRRTGTAWPGGGTQTNTYDNAGRQTSLVAKNTGGTELLKATYSYTTSGGADSDLLQSKTIAGVTTAYTYDAQRHLTKAGAVTYTVDKADNITSNNGTAQPTNAANQHTAIGATTLSYDNAGNVTASANPTTTWEYSTTNQLVRGTTSGTQTFAAGYDTTTQAQPRTITETNGATTTAHVFTQTALGVTTATRNGTRTSVSRDPDGKLVTEKVGTARYNVVVDPQGSVLGLVDTSGTLAGSYTYTPYGGVSPSGAAATANPFRYLSGYTLDGGLTLLGYRYYNSSWARFTSPDPTSQERNAYAYAQSDPINNSDPTGASTGSSVGAFLGGLAGTVIGGALVASCPATAGLGCAGAVAVVGGLTAGAGAGLGSTIGGGSRSEVRDDGLLGVAGGLVKGLGKLRGPIGKLFS